MRSQVLLLVVFCHIAIERSVAAGDLDTPSADTHQRQRRAAVIEAVDSGSLLIKEPACPDIRSLCTNLPQNADDLQTLECVQTFLSSQIEGLSDDCQHAIWKHTTQLLDDRNVLHLVQKNCTTDVKFLQDSCHVSKEPGAFLACVLDHRDELKSATCRNQMQRLEWVAFSDFRLIGPFVKVCESDIEANECGRLNADRNTLSQGDTLACLQSHLDKLSAECRKGVLHLSELQADNVKLDRKLFIACTNDARHFCADLRFGTGAVYKCLLRNKDDEKMSAPCAEQLLRRDKLIAHDYKVSKGLSRSCKDDIKNNHCRRGVSEEKNVRLAQILLCLESAHKNSSKITADCLAEMEDHRRLLMEDYHLSPEILSGCADDIPKFCDSLETGGKTIHCLMEHARPKKKKDRRVTSTCLRALELVVKVSDAAEDWRVDPVLHDACQPVVDEACREAKNGDARVMSCLMDKLGTPLMRPACEQALLQIQYFVARDFKLDPQLYRNCKEDAVHFCHAKKTWDDIENGGQMDPERGPLVLPCLHRYAYHPEPTIRLKPECLKEVKRVMHQRAVSVDLMPEVEDECIDDLAAMCFDKTEKGEEMQCLQDNLERLGKRCKSAVTEFTTDEAGDYKLNAIIMTYCRTAMEKSCAHILRNADDNGDMMECLIAHKNDAEQRPDQKCRAAIEHFQLTSLKSYHFTYKFKEACRPYVIRFCPSSNTKNEVVACLSEQMRNDTLRGQRHKIPKECRQQIRAQLYQQRENIDFDPKLKAACQAEIKELCANVPHGSGQVLECLQTNNGHLGADCAHHLFTIRKSELSDGATDYTLMTQCRDMLRQYCTKDTDRTNPLDCLKVYKDELHFDKQCHLVVVNRMIVRNLDYRFNPKLQEACSSNIAEFCTPIVAKAKLNEELNGKVVECLRAKFREGHLDKRCQLEMTEVLHEQALNYKLNPLLQAVCRDEISVICSSQMLAKKNAQLDAANGGGAVDDEQGQVEECLKLAFLEHRLMSSQCKVEVATMIEESRADIHVDPLLQQACQVDLMKYCSKVQSGNGRQLKCLQIVLADESQALESECKLKLQKRMEMFQNSAKIVNQPPENFDELYRQVVASPSANYFFLFMLCCLLIIFSFGMMCGRVTRRQTVLKNK